MILKTFFLLALSLAWEVSGASFSKVYVQTGPEVAPAVKYLEYGVPSYTYASPQIAQLTAAQIPPVFPLAPGFEAPCVPGPCLVPERTVATVASVVPGGNVFAYQPQVPSVPVVYSPKGQTSYEYMYSIYNQLHSERNDGPVVSGEYALLQPDGIVQYVADDVKGFNAIFTNILPVEKANPTVVVAQPCPEVKSEPLIVITDQPQVVAEIKEQTTEGVEPPQEAPVQEETSTVASPEPEQVVPEEKTHENIIVVDVVTEPETTTPVEAPIELVEEVPVTTQAITAVEISDDTLYVPYNDVIKCIQAAMSRLNGNPSIPSPPSPLSYIILNKPC